MPAEPHLAELLLANLQLLRELVEFLGRRYRLGPEQIEELESFVRLRLIENDYAVLRQWRRQSALRTYLTVVVNRLFRDYCNQLWGKWRVSAAARRLGPLAREIEELVYRDGLTFDEAAEAILLRRPTSRAELWALYERLPPRPGRQPGQPLGAERFPQPVPIATPEETVLRNAEQAAVTRAVAGSLRRLRAQDRLLLRLRFGEGLSVPEIARGLAIGSKPLFKRLKRVLARIRRDMHLAGVESHDVARVLEQRPSLELGLHADEGDLGVSGGVPAGPALREDSG